MNSASSRELPLPNLGDFGVCPTYGNWRDRLIGRIIRWDTSSPVNHAFVYIGDGLIVEAQPGGATRSPYDRYRNTFWSTGKIALNDTERAGIVAAARADVGVPYGWWDIVAIAFVQKRWFHGRLGRNWLWKRLAARVSRNGTLICSQLVDEAYATGGVALFADGRPAGSVSPGDLFTLIRGGAQ